MVLNLGPLDRESSDRVPRSDSEKHSMFKVSKKNIFKIINKNTRMMSGASIVIFENMLRFMLLLLLLNSNK